tara:strand:- start:24889 stop:25002 length:114 start_codon:yes stop_codon:yes gene_type:complete
MPNVTVDPLAIAALAGFGVLIIVSVGVSFVFWRLSRK